MFERAASRPPRGPRQQFGNDSSDGAELFRPGSYFVDATAPLKMMKRRSDKQPLVWFEGRVDSVVKRAEGEEPNKAGSAVKLCFFLEREPVERDDGTVELQLTERGERNLGFLRTCIAWNMTWQYQQAAYDALVVEQAKSKPNPARIERAQNGTSVVYYADVTTACTQNAAAMAAMPQELWREEVRERYKDKSTYKVQYLPETPEVLAVLAKHGIRVVTAEMLNHMLDDKKWAAYLVEHEQQAIARAKVRGIEDFKYRPPARPSVEGGRTYVNAQRSRHPGSGFVAVYFNEARRNNSK